MPRTVSPKLSLVIPVTENRRVFVSQCLADLSRQTISSEMEIILTGTGDYLNEVSADRFSGVAIRKVESGSDSLFRLWNEGLKKAASPFVSVIHPADRYRPDAFEQMTGELDRHEDIPAVYADALVTDEENETFEVHSAQGAKRFPDYDRGSLIERGFTELRPVWRSCLHRQCGYLDEGLTAVADLEFWLRISGRDRFRHIPEFLALRFEKPGYQRMVPEKKRREEFTAVLPFYENDYSGKGEALSQMIHKCRKMEHLAGGAGFGKRIDQEISKNPSNQELWLLKARHLMQDGNRKEAESFLRQAVARFPNEPRFILHRAILLWKTGHKRHAVEMLEEVIRNKPLEAQVHATLSEMYSETGQADRAIQEYVFLINHSGDHLSLYTSLIRHLLEQGELVRAHYYYHIACRKHPENAELQKIAHLFRWPQIG